MTEIVYSQTKHDLKPGQIQRNPRFFTAPEPDITAVFTVGEWPKIEEVYGAAGITVTQLDAPWWRAKIDEPPASLTKRLRLRIRQPEEGAARVALVVGSAGCVWDDVAAALDLGSYAGVVGCNHAGIYWPGEFDAWVSVHPDKFKTWVARREKRDLPAHRSLVGFEDVPPNFEGQELPGSSGLFALKVALTALRFDRAVLCGVPITPEAAHFDLKLPWTSALFYRAAWQQALPQIEGRAKSMSGWTAQLLGQPSKDWLAGG